ncbi:MAG: Re/Si-specific NAD(P)(+) transhydrogenase subunit alpha [Pseudomonadota bacterium]|nr:Re/Si-specific NAD(P)(+) transhydrogenase subunit alpha [Pseudomonadota bacterium]
MPIKLGIPREKREGERRVALDPATAGRLQTLGVDILVERGAGDPAHIPDDSYSGVTVVPDAKALYAEADLVFKVQPPETDEIRLMRKGTVVAGFMLAHQNPEMVSAMVDGGITSFAIELVPRISRAQSMDVLSSQAAVAGYKAAIMGADLCPRFFPMLTTAAGTIRPAKVLVIGAGVAGLQAIATARRLGAMVDAYDVRAETREQIESLGAKFVDIDVKAEGEGGYARDLTEEERQLQQDKMAEFIGKSDVVISTAAVPGRPAPKIISRSMVDGMRPGAVIIDLAAESGGNCDVTRPGETVDHAGITVHGPLNVPSQVAFHASEMYAKNLFNFVHPMIHEGDWKPDWEDEVIAATVLTHDGEVRHGPTRKLIEGGGK